MAWVRSTLRRRYKRSHFTCDTAINEKWWWLFFHCVRVGEKKIIVHDRELQESGAGLNLCDCSSEGTAVPDSIPSLHWLILHTSVALQHQLPLDRHSRHSRCSSLLCRNQYRDTSWCALTKSWPTLALESLIFEQICAVSLIYICVLHKPLSDGTWRWEIPQTGTVRRLI